MNTISYYQNALAIWKKMAETRSDIPLELELDLAKKINTLFHVGPFYYYIFDVCSGSFLYLDASIQTILGVDPEQFTVADFMERMHPEDVPYFLNFEQKVSEFFALLPLHQITQYKVSYDFRARKADGNYIRILHQVVTINHSDQGHVLQTLGVHTDITAIKPSGNPKLSFIGLEGAPSYLDINYTKTFTAHKNVFSIREKDIIKLLCEGYTSTEVAQKLSISQHTVNTHRKNILKKTNTKSTVNLITTAIKMGWI